MMISGMHRRPFQGRHLVLTCAKSWKWNHLSFIHISPNSYVSNWNINGKVFTSTSTWKPQNLIFFSKKFKIEFWLVLESWNHFSFVNISSTLVIDTWMERSSRVLYLEKSKIWFYFKKMLNWVFLLSCFVNNF